MGCMTSRCGCAYTWGNLKCCLMNAAAKRQARRACRCTSRRPKCLRIRRRNETICSCTHMDCRYAAPPRPLGCGPPMKSPCRHLEPKPEKIRCKCVSSECQTEIVCPVYSPMVELRTIPVSQDKCKCINQESQTQPPICPARLASCSPKPKVKVQKKCECITRESQTEYVTCPTGITVCVPPKSLMSSGENSPRVARTATPKTTTVCPPCPKSPKGKRKALRSSSTSPDKSLRWKSPESSPGTSRSESPDKMLQTTSMTPSYMCMCEEGTGDRQKNVCRFTVDAYFT